MRVSLRRRRQLWHVDISVRGLAHDCNEGGFSVSRMAVALEGACYAILDDLSETAACFVPGFSRDNAPYVQPLVVWSIAPKLKEIS